MLIYEAIRAMRPVHWVKNLLVIAPLFFSGRLAVSKELTSGLVAFAGFCFAASLGYILNDLGDVEQDRADPVKSRRPYAAGRLGVRGMLAAAVAAGAAAAVCAFFSGRAFTLIVSGYIVMALAYSCFLKRIGIMGIAIIAAGMILRILAGAAAIKVEVSVWVYPAAFLLAVYVVLGKRIYAGRLDGVAVARVESWALNILGAATLIFYLVYCFSGVGPQKYGTHLLWITAPFVGVAVVRYAFLVRRAGSRREHLETTLSDPVIVSSVLFWLAIFAVLIYK